MHVAQQKKEHRYRLWKLDVIERLLQHELHKGGPPHEHTGGQGQPLVVRDGLMLSVPATRVVRAESNMGTHFLTAREMNRFRDMVMNTGVRKQIRKSKRK